MKDWGNLVCAIGLVMCIAGHVNDNSPMVWIGCLIVIVGMIMPSKEKY